MKKPYYPNLQYLLTTHAIPRRKAAEAAGISMDTFTRRLLGETEFRLCEVEALRDKLFPGVPLEELMRRRESNA